MSQPVGTGDDGNVKIEKITDFSRRVYNLNRRIITRDWIPVQRLKTGHWMTMFGSPNSGVGSAGSVIYIALPNTSQGIPQLQRVTTGTESVGEDIPGLGDIPGMARCTIYKVEGDAITLVGDQLDVFNVFRTRQPREWCIVGQDAYGKWMVTHPPMVYRTKVLLTSNLDAAYATYCGTGAVGNYATGFLYNTDGVSDYVLSDEEVIVEMPQGFKGVWFSGETISVIKTLHPLGWFPERDGHVQFVGRSTGDGYSSCHGSQLRLEITNVDGTVTPTRELSAYFVNGGGSFDSRGIAPDVDNYSVFYEDHTKIWVCIPLTQVKMRHCAYFTWCDSAWQTWSASGSDSNLQIYGPYTGQGVFFASASVQAALLLQLTSSGVTGRFSGETVLVCECPDSYTTTTTSTTTTTTTTPTCCSQLPNTIVFELIDSGDCHYNGQSVNLIKSGNTWSWSGVTNCGDELTISLVCNPSSGGTVSALTITITTPCASPATLTGTIPGTCTCAAIESCDAEFVVTGDVSGCDCCTTTTTTTTSTTTTTTTTASYRCAGNTCGTCTMRWVNSEDGPRWSTFSSSCTGSCGSCCAPGFNGTTIGELTTVGCCDQTGGSNVCLA